MSSEIIAAATALILFVLTQGFLKFILEPMQEQRKLIGEVAYALLVYNVQVVKSLDESEACEHLRRLSGQLQASLWSLPFYDLFGYFRLVPKSADVMSAVSRLVVWSDQLDASEESRRAAAESRGIIAETLGIKTFLGGLVRMTGIESDESFGVPEVKSAEPPQEQ